MTVEYKSPSRMMLAIAGLLFIAPHAFSTGAKPWLPSVPDDLARNRSGMLPQDSFFEVPVSRLDAAEAALKDKTFERQVEPLDYWRRTDFTCKAASHPYLVRALFGYGGTGNYALQWIGTSLIINHASLGSHAVRSRKSALVVCLPDAPTKVYSSVVVAA